MAEATQRPPDGRDDGLSMPEWHEQFRQAEAVRTLIFEVDQRWYGLVQVLERTGMDHTDELVRRLADRASGTGPRRWPAGVARAGARRIMVD
jgi:hypothetical protein